MSERALTMNVGERSIPLVLADEGMMWAAQRIREWIPTSARVVMVTDEQVALLYEGEFLDALRANGIAASSHVLPVGETNKRLSTVNTLLDRLAEARLARDDFIVAVGGGVVTDMAGFTASIYRRGIPWIAIPTTVIGMVDAAIGGKTGVDHPLSKNLIGAFYQPQAVFAPVSTLRTLDRRQWLSGSAELVKSALISGGELWESVREFGPDLYTWPDNARDQALFDAACTKVRIVELDERETGLRRILNLGHTFGHALEVVTGYSTYLHGEAVFLGLRAIARISAALGMLTHAAADEIEARIGGVPLPGADVDAAAMMNAIGYDKKHVSGRLNWGLLEAPGRPVIRDDVPEALVRETADWLASVARHGGPIDTSARRKRFVVINGPNLNLLGEREPDVYGRGDECELKSLLQSHADSNHADLLYFQSNIEGEIVNCIQRARHWADGIIINPGGYTHSSVAIRDALSALKIPSVEVHISDIRAREAFRRESITAGACIGVIQGEGIAGYTKAMDTLIRRNENLS